MKNLELNEMEGLQAGWGWPSRAQWGCAVMGATMGIISGGIGAVSGLICVASLNEPELALSESLDSSVRLK
ncbi:hypothetical protein [Tenacibaculum dicentrarchi]|uniref:hypothetical protein n=1 Tax=Tenacibaculum dicentrarchi TaxID=669041 RepID=UPI0035125886